jgi:hypothetical protein
MERKRSWSKEAERVDVKIWTLGGLMNIRYKFVTSTLHAGREDQGDDKRASCRDKRKLYMEEDVGEVFILSE